MNKEKTIKELPQECRPYEKFWEQGPEFLTDAELLAIVLRTGTQGASSVVLADQILNMPESYQGLLGLQHISTKELMHLKGIGRVKAIQIKCIGELSRRIAKTSARRGLDFKDPETIARYYMEDLRHQEQEILICMMLDTKNQLLGDLIISKGTVNSSLISPRELFLNALQFHAVNIIMIHNHPSGNPAPSREDILITERIRDAGQLIGISLLDHIIIGDQQFVSFCHKGIL